MQCRDCKSCQNVIKKRWATNKWVEYRVFECWGTKEPFEVLDPSQQCRLPGSKLSEPIDNSTSCPVCSSDYHQSIACCVTRSHTSGNKTTEKVDVIYCPQCGKKL